MTTDNRTNEPTEAQVEAAARAIADCHNPGMFEKYPENWRVEARAALVAAQGVTSTAGIRALAEAEVRKSAAEGNPISEPGVTKDIAFIRGAVFGAAQGAAPQAEGECDNHRPVQHRDGKPPWCNACGLGRPVQPSSTVDEALGMIDRTLDSISEFGTTWQHHEVVSMLNDIRAALAGKEN